MWGITLAIKGVLKKKTTNLIFQLAQYEKNKFDKDNLKKINKKHVGKYCNNPQCLFSRKKLQS